MTEPVEHFDWEDFVAQTYAEVVGEARVTGITFKEAATEAAQRILAAIARDEVKPNMADVVKRALKNADDQSGKRADKLIRDTVNGKIGLFDCDEDLNAVVILGKGNRKLWRYCNSDDLEAMDSERYSNLRNAQNAYNIWRENYEVAKPIVRRYLTVEKAIEADAFGIT